MALYNQLTMMVVNVEVYSEEHEIYDCEGAGVFVSPKGHVLTLSYLLNDDPNASVRVVTKDGVVYGCSIVDVSPAVGLALFRVENPNEKMTFSYAMVHEGELNNGEEVYSVGHSFYLDYSYPTFEISYPCRLYGEVLGYIEAAIEYKRKNITNMDPSAYYVNYVDELADLRLNHSVPLVQVNNVHGDGRDGSRGMPFFNSIAHIVGIYAFAAHDKCYGIHAQCVRSYLKNHLSDVSGESISSNFLNSIFVPISR